jgi:CRISPR type III-associated protein (TIGR04423 family)
MSNHNSEKAVCLCIDKFKEDFKDFKEGYLWLEGEDAPLFPTDASFVEDLNENSAIAEAALLTQTHSYTLRSINGKLKIYRYALDYQQQDQYKIIEHLWQSKKSRHKILMHEVWRLDDVIPFSTYKPYAWVFAGFC